MAPAINDMTEDEVHAELEMFRQLGFERPARSSVDPDRPWRNGVPNYDRADLAYFRGRSVRHATGSLEAIVENAVKSWECEGTHLEFSKWHTVDHANYSVCANGAKLFVGEEGPTAGNYNWLLAGADKSLYNSDAETFDSSHRKFNNAFVAAFPWEVLRVFSGPPLLAFSWRHWGEFNGEFEGRQGDGETYEMYGFGTVKVNDDLKIQDIRIYYKPDEFIRALKGEISPSDLKNGKSLLGSGCPVMNGLNTK